MNTKIQKICKKSVALCLIFVMLVCSVPLSENYDFTSWLSFESSAVDTETYVEAVEHMAESLNDISSATGSFYINISAYNISIDDKEELIDAFAYAYPILFSVLDLYDYSFYFYAYLENSPMSSIYLTEPTDSDFTFANFDVYCENLELVVDELVEKVEGMSDFEIIVYFHDYLALNKFYDTTYSIYDAYIMLMEDSGVCQAYSYTYQLLLRSVGIGCEYVRSTTMCHGWNLVELDGEWYHVDITWDDPTQSTVGYGIESGYAGRFLRTYFLLNDEEMLAANHYDWTVDYESTSTTYSNMPRYTNLIQTYSNGSWYFCSNGYLYSCDEDGSNISASLTNKSGYGIAIYEDYYIYGSGEDIKAQSLTNTSDLRTIYTLDDTTNNSYLYFTFFVDGDDLYYYYDLSSNFKYLDTDYQNRALILSISAIECDEPVSIAELSPCYYGHTPTTTIEYQAPTCTTAGHTVQTECSVCGIVITYTEEIAATGHSYNDGEITTSPTCTEKGIMTYTCESCNGTYTEEIAATGHSCNDGEITTAATCTSTGVMTYKCTVCGDTYTESIAKTAHTYTSKVTAATCTSDGYTTNTCSACGYSYKSNTVVATGHSYGSWVTTKASTATTKGVQTATCKYCGATKTQSLDYVSPTSVSSITAENGSTWLTLNWKADAGATGYQIYMDGKKIATLYDSETTYTVTDLDGSSDYEFYIRSFSKATGSTVWGSYSKTYTFTTNPYKAKFSSSSSTSTSITVNWSETDGADGYRVYMQIDGTYTSLKTVSASTLSYTITGLDTDTEYSFKVKAYTRDVDGTAQFGVASDAYAVSTTSYQVVMTTYTNTTSAIRINWEEISVADGYRVYQYINGKWKTIATIQDGSTTTYRIGDLDDGTIYKFKVKAFIRNSSGTAIFQDASDTFTTMTDLATVKITSSSKTSSAIRLNWNEVDGATGYKVYIYVDGAWKTYATIYDGDTTTYRLSGLDSNTKYKFKVQAFSKETGSTVWGAKCTTYSVTTSK